MNKEITLSANKEITLLANKECTLSANKGIAFFVNKEIILSRVELNILHHVAGYIVSSIINTQKHCHKCIKYVGCRKISQFSYNRLTALRAFQNNNTLR